MLLGAWSLHKDLYELADKWLAQLQWNLRSSW